MVFAGAGAQSASDAPHSRVQAECSRGHFPDYYRQGEGGDPPAGYKGPIFRLSQDFPSELPPKEAYPWLNVPFREGAPQDPEAYLSALLAYGLEGNVEAGFVAQQNPLRRWYHMPWMHWNTEVASDWGGTDGREFVHGLTHEFDSSPKMLSEFQGEFVDTWSGSYFNDRAGFGIGQVYCDPQSPDPAALNPDPDGLNAFADGAFVIKLLFSTIDEEQLPQVVGALEWQADTFVNVDPPYRNKGPIERFERKVQTIRLLQIDVAVRDDRSLNGWLFGTFAYDGAAPGGTAWDRMVPIGLQWGNDPALTYRALCGEDGRCDTAKLQQQWINRAAVTSLDDRTVHLDHLGYGGRLAGPVDEPVASCMGCHQTAGFPLVAPVPEGSPNARILSLDRNGKIADNQSFRMRYFGNLPSGVVFSDSQLVSSDYSLQLAMSLQNFMSRRCSPNPGGDAKQVPGICGTLKTWADAQRKALEDLLPARDNRRP